eukprot:1140308-Pelagomonas_calceolata.AAC.4
MSHIALNAEHHKSGKVHATCIRKRKSGRIKLFWAGHLQCFPNELWTHASCACKHARACTAVPELYSTGSAGTGGPHSSRSAPLSEHAAPYCAPAFRTCLVSSSQTSCQCPAWHMHESTHIRVFAQNSCLQLPDSYKTWLIPILICTKIKFKFLLLLDLHQGCKDSVETGGREHT